MTRARRTRIKVCCIDSLDEAVIAAEAGADAIGLVGRMPSGPGPIPDATIGEIAGQCPPGVNRVLLTSRTEPDPVTDHVWRSGVDTVQLVGDVPRATWAALRRHCPWVTVLQVVHVEGPEAVDQARAAAECVDGLVLDSGRPGAPRPELGGTGRVHDWRVSRRIVAEVGVPVFLAGGLRPENVADAIAEVRPWGVDVCSGVRTEGGLDRERLARFVAAVGNADGA